MYIVHYSKKLWNVTDRLSRVQWSIIYCKGLLKSIDFSKRPKKTERDNSKNSKNFSIVFTGICNLSRLKLFHIRNISQSS